MVKQLVCLFKLRIGIVMMITALAAMAVTPGRALTGGEILVLALAVLLSAGAAGAFNQYYETDLDERMRRTDDRPFVTGTFHKGPGWLAVIVTLLLAGVGGAAWILNGPTAVYIFLGAFFYAVVYTVWLKRRTWMNIVIGGASGSFAVLAGAASVNPEIGPVALLLALVLFFWTPSHFWSLAIARHDDYVAAGVPMLPVVVGDRHAAKVVLANTLALVGISLLPCFFGMGWIYLTGAVTGGGYFLYRNLQMVIRPNRKTAMNSFFASLIQLALLLGGAMLDASLPA